MSLNHRTQPGGGAPAGGPLMRETVSPVTLRGDGAVSAKLPESILVAEAAALEFSVRYALLEYCSFMWQHAAHLIRRRRVGRLPGTWLLVKSTLLAGLHFVAQGRSRHLYQFTIDEHGIIRTGPGGVTLLPWADVSAIRTYGPGFVVVLARGTLPIPRRCLSAAQAGAMVGFASMVRAARSAHQ